MATKAPPEKATRNSNSKPAAAAAPKSRLVRNVVNAAYLDKPAHLRTRQQRSDAGKALRVSCPRESQAGFEPAADRTDPIDLLIRSSTGRDEQLMRVPRRRRWCMHTASACANWPRCRRWHPGIPIWMQKS